MQDLILSHEIQLRLLAAIAILVFIGFWEFASPSKPLQHSKCSRWLNNFGLAGLNIALLRIVFPVSAAAIAVWTQQHSIGILHKLQLSFITKTGIAVIMLDFAIWLQHRLMHAVPILWRLHRVHHADPDIDLSTASRFHPFEMIFSMALKILLIVILGIPVQAVVLFEILLHATAVFSHGNIRIPKTFDFYLRRFIVTPDMHYLHHSQNPSETNRNFGFFLSIWDWMFKTHKDSCHGNQSSAVGTQEFINENDIIPIQAMLALPFKSPKTPFDLDPTKSTATSCQEHHE
jgi:sterol desaturase/sphingolipid hydroxylase (fatty acid hydroxylase superfamily)